MSAAVAHSHPNSFIAQLPLAQRKIAAALRALIQRVVPEVVETVLWDSLSYHRPKVGGRVKGAVCLITPKPQGVHLAFIHGVALPDPVRLLKGTRRAKRFVPIRDIAEIDSEALGGLIKAAGDYVPKPA